MRNSGATATSAKPPSRQHAATRSPSLTCAPSGALRTTPATSLPGTNGSGGFTWYSPRVWSTSGNETPAACTSTTTARSPESMCAASGSGRSTTLSASAGPSRSVICTARTAQRNLARRVDSGVAGRRLDRRVGDAKYSEAEAGRGSRTVVTASRRLLTPNLTKIDERWLLTVLSARYSLSAICALQKPSTTSPSTCFSRAESDGGVAWKRAGVTTICPRATARTAGASAD